jgi:ABC-2 type transport system permease protein/lipopolysaccharide transport system permease protein
MNNADTPFTFDSKKDVGLRIFLQRNTREIVIYRYALYNFINSNLRARYRRSTLGFLWTLLNPLFTMLILTAVFSTIYKLPFADFGVYIFSGLLPWTLISLGIIGGSMSIINAEGYLKKVYVPKLIFPIATIGIETINFFFSWLSLSFLAFFLGVRFGLEILLLPVALAITALFILGLALIMSIATIYFRDMTHITQIVLAGLFYLTPIIYKPEFVPDSLAPFMKLNPFFYFIELFHLLIYENKIPDSSLWLMCSGLMISSLVIGVIVFKKKDKEVIYRL